MKVAIHFEDSGSLLILIPENSREEQLISLATDGKPHVTIKVSTSKDLYLEFKDA